ncbi:MAG TPA: VOC family protein [Ramlibacter sp.]|uniref:VOC family protein n=1 Tax=Ramlibacter sp. TaxID=1917967 RepID=UPI002ED59CF2
MSSKAKRLQNVYLVARDVAAQSAFYERVLGLPAKFRDGTRWAQYDAGGPGFAIACAEEARPAENGAVLVFEVDDFEGVEESVVAAGGRVEARRDMGSHGSVLSLSDPEGNIVQMFRRAPKPQ